MTVNSYDIWGLQKPTVFRRGPGVVDSRLAVVIAFSARFAQSDIPTLITRTAMRTKMSVVTAMNKSKRQFSLRATFILIAVSAVWVWIFREMTPFEMAVVAGIAVTAGLLGHIVYTYLLSSRVTVIATVLLVYNALLGAQLLLEPGSGTPTIRRLAFLFDILVLPLEMMKYATAPRDIMFWLVMVLGTLIFTPAHAIRPSLPSAIITGLGIAIWYGVSIMMMAYGG